ncbi:hypothetical protein [Reichenbachiella ulvae]|uniref:Uncharacterized protein n=1 Tax=Reichenbachiella ulvae TaxID=2980104 RepID=A0ABT3CYQ2_9BACT|nr:hypothetical protein [Reichenbachiella ulvae]MCV9388654.1 hypothetical protein [Reichenbachiella ulvae]
MKFNQFKSRFLPLTFFALLLIGVSCSETHQLKTKQAVFEESLFLKYELVKYKLVKLTSMSRNPSIEGLNSRFRYANLPDSSYQGQIVIIDANKNDKFEYDSMDFVGLTSFDKKLRLEPISSIQSNRPVIVRIGGKNFEVTFDEKGEQITLTESSKEYDLAFPYQLPSEGAKALSEAGLLHSN